MESRTLREAEADRLAAIARHRETYRAPVLSLKARAAMLARAESRKATVNVNRSPNAPLAPTFDNARDALEAALDATSDVRPERERAVRKSIAAQSIRPKIASRDTFGPVLVQGSFTRYGTHYRTRLVSGERRQYLRTDAWAKARSQAIGEAKVQHVKDSRLIAGLRERMAARQHVAGNGGYARIWTASGERSRFRDYATVSLGSRGDDATDDSLWATFTTTDDDGRKWRCEFNRETGETKNTRPVA